MGVVINYMDSLGKGDFIGAVEQKEQVGVFLNGFEWFEAVAATF